MTIAYLANPNRLRWLASDDDAVVLAEDLQAILVGDDDHVHYFSKRIGFDDLDEPIVGECIDDMQQNATYEKDQWTDSGFVDGSHEAAEICLSLRTLARLRDALISHEAGLTVQLDATRRGTPWDRPDSRDEPLAEIVFDFGR